MEKLHKLWIQGGERVIWANTKLFFLLQGGHPLIATDFPNPVKDVESFMEKKSYYVRHLCNIVELNLTARPIERWAR